MACSNDTYKLIPAAMNWDGTHSVMADIAKDIAIASNDANECDAARIAASILLADDRLRAMQRAQCEAALAMTVPDIQQAKLHLGKADTEFKKFEKAAGVASLEGAQVPGVNELRQQINDTRKMVEAKKKTNVKRALPQDPGRPRPCLSNGSVKPLVPLATFSSAYATVTGRLVEIADGAGFLMQNGNTPFRVKAKNRGLEKLLAFRRVQVTKIFHSDHSPIVIVSAQIADISDAEFAIEFADCEHIKEFRKSFGDLAVNLPEAKFKVFVAEACKNIKVRKAELELEALRAT